VKAQGRGGWGVGFHLSYNSQNWTEDVSNVWIQGRDVGYGFGWRLQAGSLRAVYQGWFAIHHYVFTDSTGAEYRLDQNNNGVWSSRESLYVWYDSNTQRLYFNDGSFWVFGATAAGTEQDAGTSYPTLMEDTNGNQIAITYQAGVGVPWSNSSARILTIQDVRTGSYTLTYSVEWLPHLTGISNSMQTGESYSFRTAIGVRWFHRPACPRPPTVARPCCKA